MPQLASQPSADLSAAVPRDGLPRPGRIPGNQAIWVGIFSEMSEFGIMFLAFFIAKAHYPVLFLEGPTRLNTTAGLVNTLVLLSSSYFVAKAMVAIRQERRRDCVRWLWAAIGAAVAYLVVKYIEYEWNSAHGISIDTNSFFAVYYYMTFNHLLHVGWGGGAILWAIMRLKMGAYSADDHEGLEAVAVYWHMIDLAWIVMFPLVYVLR
ncbi:MAG TPA: cytochrome c oxidase subunit 3 family protein [Gammaproteobacteria bacterium]|nr:cytochrome c oxidase subunit 3 family protein [Gammaproteobacteria bacterium]